MGEKIRELLLDPSYTEIMDRTEALLYAAARAQLVAQVIRPRLEQGTVVLCDRYIDSTLAYQGYGRGMDLPFLSKINELASGGLAPNLTVLLDLSPEEGLARSRKEKIADRLESQSLTFYHKVRRGYLELAQRKPELYLVLDARQNTEQLHQVICARIGGIIGV
ncbi:dTMP kinase [Desulfotomaculum defluvii]